MEAVEDLASILSQELIGEKLKVAVAKIALQ